MSSVVIGIALTVVALLLAARLGAFAGRAPADLGVTDGALKRPSRTPNCVTSQLDRWPDAAQRPDLRVEPIALQPGGGPATIARIAQVIEDLPNAQIVERRDDYVYAQFTSALMRFIDDTEFWFDPAAGVVQVRSASRVGRKDFGVNRARIEAIRSRLG